MWRDAALIWLSLATLLAFALRATALTGQPLWWDEGYTFWFSTESLSRLIELTSLDIHPPLYYLLLKGAGSGVTWSNGHSTLNLSDATRDYGAATLGIRIKDDWTSDQTLWLIENQNLFDNLDWLPDGTVASVAYYGGQLSNLLIHWLAKTPRAKKVILFPDYDGVGLMNYARLRSELTEDCEFWLMHDWSRLLEKYGNPKVWLDNLDSFEAAYDRLYDGADQALLQLMETMRKQAMALEQEAIWLTIGERNHPNG